jgi:hypothetical protein
LDRHAFKYFQQVWLWRYHRSPNEITHDILETTLKLVFRMSGAWKKQNGGDDGVCADVG